MNTTSSTHLEEVCHAIANQLKALAQSRCKGQMSEREFIDAVLAIEARDLAPQDLTLTASNTIDDWTVFKVKVNGAKEACAAFEFLPETGEFRRVGCPAS